MGVSTAGPRPSGPDSPFRGAGGQALPEGSGLSRKVAQDPPRDPSGNTRGLPGPPRRAGFHPPARRGKMAEAFLSPRDTLYLASSKTAKHPPLASSRGDAFAKSHHGGGAHGSSQSRWLRRGVQELFSFHALDRISTPAPGGRPQEFPVTPCATESLKGFGTGSPRNLAPASRPQRFDHHEIHRFRP